MPSSAGRVQRATNIMRAAVGIGRRQVGRGIERMGTSVARQQERSAGRSARTAVWAERNIRESTAMDRRLVRERGFGLGNTEEANAIRGATAREARGRVRSERRNAQTARAVAEVGRRMSRR